MAALSVSSATSMVPTTLTTSTGASTLPPNPQGNVSGPAQVPVASPPSHIQLPTGTAGPSGIQPHGVPPPPPPLPSQAPATSATGGGASTKKYNGRSYKIRTGERGGKYILVKGKKIYVKERL